MEAKEFMQIFKDNEGNINRERADQNFLAQAFEKQRKYSKSSQSNYGKN